MTVSTSCGLTETIASRAPLTAAAFDASATTPYRSESSALRSGRRAVTTRAAAVRQPGLKNPRRSDSPSRPAPTIAIRRSIRGFLPACGCRSPPLRGLGDHPRVPEAAHLPDDREERASLLGQLVLDAGRRFRIAAPDRNALPLEHVEPLGERARADAGARVLELHEPARAFGHVMDDQRRPFGGDDLCRRRDRAARAVSLVHRSLHVAGVYWERPSVATETKAVLSSK